MSPKANTERHLVVVLGGTGDLMRRKLLPVLFNLTREGAGCHVLAVARSRELPTPSTEPWRR